MTSTRGNWLRLVLAALSVLLMGVSTARAQGFGPDPYQPWSSMYEPYVRAIGPASPGAGQSGGAVGRAGWSSANQFQQYMLEQQGAWRAGVQRYGIGTPYYRSAVDPLFDTEGKRDYLPNRQTAQTFEDGMDRVTRKYLAYFSEKDPKKRAILMRDYRLTERNFNRLMSSRRGSLPDELGGAARGGSGLRTGLGTRLDDENATAREMLRSRTRLSDGDTETSRGGRAAAGDRVIPRAPEIGPSTGRRATPEPHALRNTGPVSSDRRRDAVIPRTEHQAPKFRLGNDSAGAASG